MRAAVPSRPPSLRRAAAALAAILVLCAAAAARADGVTFTIRPRVIEQGQVVTLRGTGWRPFRYVTIRTVRPGDTSGRWYDALRYRANRRGVVQARVKVNIDPGYYRMTASQPGRRSVRATFWVESAAAAGAPRALGPPAITGSARTGSVLSADLGAWADAAGATFTHAWYRCDAQGLNCSRITTAAGATYLVESADLGGTIRVQVTAVRDGASSTGPVSEPTAVVTRASGTTTTTPTTPPTTTGPCPAGQVQNPLHPDQCCACSTTTYGAENPGCALACHNPSNERRATCRQEEVFDVLAMRSPPWRAR